MVQLLFWSQFCQKKHHAKKPLESQRRKKRSHHGFGNVVWVFPPVYWVAYGLFRRDHSTKSTWLKRNFLVSVSARKSGTPLRKLGSYFCTSLSSFSILSVYRQKSIFSRLDFNGFSSLALAPTRYLHRRIQYRLHHWRQRNSLCSRVLYIFQWCLPVEYEIFNSFNGCCPILWKFNLGRLARRIIF